MVQHQSVEIKELQQKALEMYKYFEAFCDEHDLRLFVCGGACIGALRHQGFIPWDDDIDLFMPRPDYERLVKLWRKHGDKDTYTLCRTDENVNYHDGGTLLKLNNTTFINRHSVNEDIHHGYMMDIIPLDGCAPSGIKRTVQKINGALYSLFNVQRLPDNQGQMVRIVAKIVFGVFRSPKLRYKVWKANERRMSRYPYDKSSKITELVTGFRYMKNEYPTEIFGQGVDVPFEDTTIRIPQDADKYLRMAFGEYMSLPPEEERVPKHDVVFIDLNHSYKEYRGDKYLVTRERK